MAAGIYIHIPFCIRKCFYCDFFSLPGDNYKLRREYTRALIYEIAFYGKRYGKNLKADTVFFGGGTPSLMEPGLISKITEALKKNFDIASDAEITMECNPATLTPEKLDGYRRAGINRLSIGAQSFNDDVLQNLGRIHKAEDIEKTFDLARQSGFCNINMDLMFAVPGLTLKEWRKTIKHALRLKPEHISFYSLEISEDTVFGHMVSEGRMKETPVETDRSMYHEAAEAFKKAGFNHYEISNAAMPGRECRHNLKYWSFSDYLGLGASAHSFINRVRFSNVSDVDQYINAMDKQDMARGTRLGASDLTGAGCIDYFHVNSAMDSIAEYTFTALRTKKGVDFCDFEKRFKIYFWDVFGKERSKFEDYVKDGYALSDSRHIAITCKGIDISNRIMALFV